MVRTYFNIAAFCSILALTASCNCNTSNNTREYKNDEIATNWEQPRIGGSDVIVFYYDKPIEIVPSPKHKLELPKELRYGKIVAPIFPDSCVAENNMMRQVRTYNSALLHGDTRTCGKFLYPDAFTYCRRYYPGFSDEKVMELFCALSEDARRALKVWSENGINVEMIVANLERKVIVGDDVIIVFNMTSNQCSEDVFIHYPDMDKTIGISRSKGRNWWFMAEHDDLPTILSMHYQDEVVNAVMGY